MQTLMRGPGGISKLILHRLAWLRRLCREFLSVAELADDGADDAGRFPPPGLPHF